MRRLFILGSAAAAALVVGIAIAVAATGGSGSASQSGGAAVSIKTIGGAGKVLVDSKGRALYMNDEERGGKVLCTGACLAFWTPLIVSGTPKDGSLQAKLAVVKRPDGKRQVTFDHKLLYSFVLDKPGKVTGDGFKDAFGGQKFTWHVAHPGGTLSPTSGGTTGTNTNPYPGY